MKKYIILFLAGLAVLTAKAQNPYLPLWEHLPDGEPRVFGDPDVPGRKRAYIIGSHDTHFNQYCGNDIRMWSAPVEDLTQWRDGKLLDKEGSEYKALYKDQNPLDFNFFEASSIRQVGNKYVMVFSGYSGKEYGLDNTNSALRYAFGDSPLGP